jgi:copper chaperone
MATIRVKGMTCGHCAQAVTKALSALPGVSGVQVDLQTGLVTFEQSREIPREELSRVIRAAGYELGES